MERNLSTELIEVIQSNKSDEEIKSILNQYHDNDIAAVFAELSLEARQRLYQILDNQQLSDIFSYLDDVEEFVEELESEQVADIIELMDADDAIDVLEELDPEDRDVILDLMEKESAEDVKLIFSQDEDTIGSIMTTNFIKIPKTFTVKQAMKHVIKEAPENDNISIIYVVNEDNSYYGTIDLRDLIIARSDQPLEEIIRTSYPILYTDSLIDDSILKLKEYSLDLIPVLNRNKEIMGVVTSDDIIELVDEEFGEDYAKFGGLSSEEDLEEPVFRSVRKRMPWLVTLLILGTGISLVISNFESIVIVLPMLVFFQSLILDMAGNAGTQSLAVTIRVLTDEKITNQKLRQMIFKELRVGISNGLLLGVLSFAVVFLFSILTKSTIVVNQEFSVALALKAASVVSFALLIAMSVSSMVGTLIPILLTKMKFDPAVASGPFITTVNDVVAVMVYYSFAIFMFQTFL